MSEPMWTVVGLDSDTGQVIADHVHAADEHAAFAEFVRTRTEFDNLLLVGCVPDFCFVATPCDDTGKACYAVDYPSDATIWTP